MKVRVRVVRMGSVSDATEIERSIDRKVSS